MTVTESIASALQTVERDRAREGAEVAAELAPKGFASKLARHTVAELRAWLVEGGHAAPRRRSDVVAAIVAAHGFA